MGYKAVTSFPEAQSSNIKETSEVGEGTEVLKGDNQARTAERKLTQQGAFQEIKPLGLCFNKSNYLLF